MNTYLFKDATHYKIGKSLNVYKRFCEIKPYNPTVEIVTSINENIESELHKKYRKNRVKGEWFVFNKEEIYKLIKHDFKNPKIDDILYKEYIIKDGKYKDRYLISMFKEDEINWLYSFDNDAFNYWRNNYTRYFFLKKDILSLKLVSSYENYKEKHQMICDLKTIINNLPLLTIEAYSDIEKITYNGVKKRIKNGVLNTIQICGKTFIIN